MMKKRWPIGTLATNAVEILRCDASRRITIDSIHFVNFTTGNTAVDLYHVPDGEEVSENFHLVRNHSVSANTAFRLVDQRIYLEPGDRLFAFADAADHLNCFIYGEEYGG